MSAFPFYIVLIQNPEHWTKWLGTKNAYISNPDMSTIVLVLCHFYISVFFTVKKVKIYFLTWKTYPNIDSYVYEKYQGYCFKNRWVRGSAMKEDTLLQVIIQSKLATTFTEFIQLFGIILSLNKIKVFHDLPISYC